MKYACVVSSHRVEKRNRQNMIRMRTNLFFVKADNQELAEQQAIHVGNRTLPKEEGWQDHYIHVRSVDEPSLDMGGEFIMEKQP